MIDPRFVVIGALLNLWGSISYVISTIQGKTRPNRVTWFLWALAPLIAFSAQISSGVRYEAVMTLMVGLGPLMIFIASFVNAKAYWKIGTFDIACGVFSVLAIVLWQLSGSAIWAIVFSILADILAGIPTIVKSYKAPETENSIVFRNGAISAGITLLAVQVWNVANYAFAVYILLMCVLLYCLIRFRIGPRLKS